MGGDDRMPAIVGYSDKGTLNPDNLPVNLKSFLAAYKATVESVEKGDTSAVKNVKAAMKREAGSYTPIAPLLGGIEWSQNAPFNNLCPNMMVSTTLLRVVWLPLWHKSCAIGNIQVPFGGHSCLCF